MADAEEPTAEPSTTAPVEIVHSEVMIAIPEPVLLDMLRQVTQGADPDLVYIEFFANDNLIELIPVSCGCECSCADGSEDDCECCTCEDDDDGDDETPEPA